ncbi:MAG: hypothetical protein LQ351_003432 [Letrouitia transgressa]|nr:MAG: hypothetical protein LQ351_003432 [Letrouitia transgressa]
MFLIHHYALLLVLFSELLLTRSAAFQDVFSVALPLDTRIPQVSAPKVNKETIDIDAARISHVGDLLATNAFLQNIICHIPSRAVTRTNSNECRAVFRAFTDGIRDPQYRSIQRFAWRQQPLYPHTPPYRVNVAHNNCEFNITLANEHIVSDFSFEQAKQLGQQVLQECEDAGYYYGGFAPLTPGRDDGWRVEVGGVPEWRRDRVGVPPFDSTELSSNTPKDAVRAVAVPRELQPRDKSHDAQRSISPMTNSTTPSNVQIHCFQPLAPLVRLSFDQCRPVFRRLATFVTGPGYRLVQPFTLHYRPTHPYPPPYYFRSPGSRCTLNITSSNPHAIAAFSFEYAKDLAQRAVQTCQDQGRNYGGFALLDPEEFYGWRVEVGAIEGKIPQEGIELIDIGRALKVKEEPQEFVQRSQDSVDDSTTQSTRLDPDSDIGNASAGEKRRDKIGFNDSSIEPLKARADVLPHGPVQCHHNRPSDKTIRLASCGPVFHALIAMAGDQYTIVSRFYWHSLPKYPHPPPYAITTKMSPCELIITTHDVRQIAQFSFQQANLLAQNILRECEFQGLFYGGTASIVSLENTGWEVEIRKRTEWDTQTHQLEWQNQTKPVEPTRIDKREMSVDAPNSALIKNATSDFGNALAYGPIQCYHPSSDRSRTSFAECRNTFRNIAGYFGYHYRLVQSFYWHQMPQYPHAPPYRFYILGEDCELNITTEDRTILEKFSFEQAKLLGQDIMEECTHNGYSYGGYAPIVGGKPRGWRVEVGGRTGTGSSEIDVVAKVFRRGSLPGRSPLSFPSTSRHDPGAKLSPSRVEDLEKRRPVVERAIAPSSPELDAGMIWCYPPSQWHPPVHFSECRKIFRVLPDIMSSHQWITKQRFFAHRSPRFPEHPPPFYWRFTDVDCLFNITTTDPSVIEEFSFMDAKQLAQEVLQECEDRRQYRGGFAALFREKPRGWRVEIGGKHPLHPLLALPTNFSIARRSPAPAVNTTTVQLEEDLSASPKLSPATIVPSPPRLRAPRIYCFTPHADRHRTTFADCRKVFRILPTIMESWRFRRVQHWVRGRSPFLPRAPGYPPFRFGAPASNCKFGITVIDSRIEGDFSFEEAKNLAQDVLQECEERGLHLGGNALIDPAQTLGWRVEVYGKAEPEPPGGELILGEAELGSVNETTLEKN